MKNYYKQMNLEFNKQKNKIKRNKNKNSKIKLLTKIQQLID